ncbi:MAG: hypothetical protein ACOZIN_07425 [Myxococcota bacterium]
MKDFLLTLAFLFVSCGPPPAQVAGTSNAKNLSVQLTGTGKSGLVESPLSWSFDGTRP